MNPTPLDSLYIWAGLSLITLEYGGQAAYIETRPKTNTPPKGNTKLPWYLDMQKSRNLTNLWNFDYNKNMFLRIIIQNVMNLGPLYTRAWGPCDAHIRWLVKKLETIQVHFTLDLEGPRDPQICKEEKSTWPPTQHQVNNVLRFTGYCIGPFKRRCV
jgi:hypothetical protein